MIKSHSLFFGFVFLLASCNQTRQEPKPLAQTYLDSIENPKLPEERVHELAKLAYNAAVDGHDPRTLQNAFDKRYSILFADSTGTKQHLLRDYFSVAKSRNDTLNLANAYYYYGNEYMSQSLPEDAFKYYNLSRAKYELLQDSLNVAQKLILMAGIYSQYNDYFGMESATTQALQFIDRRVRTAYDSIYVSIAYNNFGLVHTNLGNHQDALQAYETALKYSTDAGTRGIEQNNMAWTMMEMGDYQSAVEKLNAVRKNKAALEYHETRSKVLGNLGYSYFKLGDSRALSLLEESVSIRRSNNDNFGLIAGLVHLSEFHASSNKPLAEKYALEALQIAKSLKSSDDRISVLQQLRKITSGQTREMYSEEVIRITDSISSVRQKARNQFAKYRFDASEALNENLKLKAQTAQGKLEIVSERNGKILFALGLVATVIIGAMSYLLIRRRHKQEKLRENYETETRIAKKVHDELANDVFRAISFAESQDLSIADKRESLLQNLDHVYSRARDISRENNSVNLGPGFKDELGEMLSDYNSDQSTVIVQGLGTVKWESVPENVKIAVFRVLQELMVNMVKHSKAEVAAVKFINEGKLVKISYSDNGIGLKDENFRSNGFVNMENRIKTNGGTFSFGSNDGKGLKFEMAFS